MLDHVAIEVKDCNGMLEFFGYVFGCKITKDIVSNGHRKVWIDLGIQFNENPDADKTCGFLNHIAIKVSDCDGVIFRALEKGCVSLPAGKNWLMMPQGICLEVLSI